MSKLRLALATVVLFLSLWIVVPAPSRLLLPLAVGAPELSPWLLAVSLVLLGLSALHVRRSKLAAIAALLAASSAVLATLPLVRIPATTRRFDEAMVTALGKDALLGDDTMRPTPIVLRDLFLGIKADDPRIARGIEIAKREGVALTLDLYRPRRTDPSPIVVQIYGGGWQRGSPSDDETLARHLASTGYLVVAIDYRHAPRWTWPSQIEDVDTALVWIREHAAAHGGDPTRMALLGRSAGAQLALVAAYRRQDPAIRAVVSLYGPVDLAEGWRRTPRPDPIKVRTLLEAYLGGTPDSVPDRYRDASPITYASASSPPTLLIYGARDHVVEHRFGEELDHRLRKAGATSILLEIPWAEHAFDAIPNGPSGQLTLYYVERFLARTMGTSP